MGEGGAGYFIAQQPRKGFKHWKDWVDPKVTPLIWSPNTQKNEWILKWAQRLKWLQLSFLKIRFLMRAWICRITKIPTWPNAPMLPIIFWHCLSFYWATSSFSQEKLRLNVNSLSNYVKIVLMLSNISIYSICLVCENTPRLGPLVWIQWFGPKAWS